MKGALSLVIAGFLSLSAASEAGDQGGVCIRERCFSVEVPETPSQISRGLMFRSRLDPEKGMFFIFPVEGIHPFWMKNMRISLDILWIDEDREVVFIHRGAAPCESEPCPGIDPGRKAKYVLEINGGLSDRFGFSVGDKAIFR